MNEGDGAPAAGGGSKKRVLEAAAELFLDQGIRGTSIDMIARRARCSKQTIYIHFTDKEQILLEAVALIKQEIDEVDPPTAHDVTFPAQLIHLTGTYLRLMTDARSVAAIRLCIEASQHLDQRFDLEIDSGPVGVEQVIKQHIASLQADGVLSGDDPDFATEALLGMVRGNKVLRHLFKDAPALSDDELLQHVVRCVDLFCSGLQSSVDDRGAVDV